MPEMRLYQTALQHPNQCFLDDELKMATVEKGPGGWMPLAWAGQFAVVFKLRTSKGYQAVRCFYQPQNEHEERYKLLHQHLQTYSPDGLIRFEFLHDGIRLNETIYPIVKMDWVEGETLDKKVSSLVMKQEVSGLDRLSTSWRDTVIGLWQASIAHGDMQHGNILAQNGSLQLVDYDGVFIPSFHGKKALETGHRNYQHPRRKSDNFGLHIDHFSSFVIYLSLKALAANPSLWNTYHHDDYLILKNEDYAAPHKSTALKSLKKSSESEIRELARKLEELCIMQLEDLPSFAALVGAPVPQTTKGNQATQGGKQWWQDLTDTQPASMRPSVTPPPVPPSPLPKPGMKGQNRLVQAILVFFIVIGIMLCAFLAIVFLI